MVVPTKSITRKRGGDAQQVSLDEVMVVCKQRDADLVALDDALSALADVDPSESLVVELCCYGGLSVAETAGVLKVSSDTVLRDWKWAKVWLLREMGRKENQVKLE